VLVALEQSELVGFATSKPSQDVVDAVELSELLVEPRWGGRGHGSRLLAAAIEHWRSDFTLALAWAFEAGIVMTSFLESAGWSPDGVGRGLDAGPRLVHRRRFHSSLA
jgi:GNAT superfamily N-acetyltransferase